MSVCRAERLGRAVSRSPATATATARRDGPVGSAGLGALHGYTYDQILAADYPGTVLSHTRVSRIHVLLADGQKRLTVSSDQPITVVDGDGVDPHTSGGERRRSPPATRSSPTTAAPVSGAADALAFAPSGGSTLTLGTCLPRQARDQPRRERARSSGRSMSRASSSTSTASSPPRCRRPGSPTRSRRRRSLRVRYVARGAEARCRVRRLRSRTQSSLLRRGDRDTRRATAAADATASGQVLELYDEQRRDDTLCSPRAPMRLVAGRRLTPSGERMPAYLCLRQADPYEHRLAAKPRTGARSPLPQPGRSRRTLGVAGLFKITGRRRPSNATRRVTP